MQNRISSLAHHTSKLTSFTANYKRPGIPTTIHANTHRISNFIAIKTGSIGQKYHCSRLVCFRLAWWIVLLHLYAFNEPKRALIIDLVLNFVAVINEMRFYRRLL